MSSEYARTCPKCGYEYQKWVEICPDCGSALQDAPRLKMIRGQLDPEKDPRWTVVTNVPNAIIGNFMKSQLEDAGIPVLMRRMGSVDIAEFSHNDFVPQDLLVPMHRLREARELIDSPPGDFYGPQMPDEYDYEESEEPESDTGEQSEPHEEPGILPPGWSMLPTEADVDARQRVRRSHGEVLKGWYWSDDRQLSEEQTPRPASNFAPQWEEPEYDDYRRVDQGFYGPAQPYSYGPARWIRLVYAILLLVLSLPFLLQILGQIFSILGNFR